MEDTILEVQDGVIDASTIFNRIDKPTEEIVDNGETNS